MEELLIGLGGYALGVLSMVAYRYRPRRRNTDPNGALKLYQQMKNG